jgi:2-dehydropantoate 2-reductase
MRVAVVGVGALGGYFGALLANAGNDVTLIARGEQLEALRTRGLTLRSHVVGDITVHPAATDRCEEVGPVELVMMCVKTYALEAAAVQARPLVGPDTVIVPVQNGVDAAESIGQSVGFGPVLRGTTFVNAHREGPGVVRHSGGQRLVFGELSGAQSPRTARLCEVFLQAGITAEARSDIRLAMWEKFAGISSAGALAVARLPLGPVLACPETREFVRQTIIEAVAVGRAHGVMLPDDYAERFIALVTPFPAWTKPSMLVDLEAGRRLELEAINGTVVRMGRERGVTTPTNTTIYAALKPYADGVPNVPAPPR